MSQSCHDGSDKFVHCPNPVPIVASQEAFSAGLGCHDLQWQALWLRNPRNLPPKKLSGPWPPWMSAWLHRRDLEHRMPKQHLVFSKTLRRYNMSRKTAEHVKYCPATMLGLHTRTQNWPAHDQTAVCRACLARLQT